MGTPKKAPDRRDFPRLRASFGVRFAICGHHGREVPGFTTDVSCGGLSFCSPDTRAKVGDHLSLEITVPGFAAPLYFLGEVVRVEKRAAGYEVACRFDWLGQSYEYKEKLEAFISAHDDDPRRAPSGSGSGHSSRRGPSCLQHPEPND